MSNTSEDKTIQEQILFDLEDGVKEFEKLRWNRSRTKKVLSPELTGISKCPSFHKLILLCSEHDHTILRSVLQNALEKCTEIERRMNEEKESKKREAEELDSGPHKKAKTQYAGKATTAFSQQSQPKPVSPAVSKIAIRIASQASSIQSALPVMEQASTSSGCQSPQDMNGMGPILSPAVHLASSSEDVVPTCDKRSMVEDIQEWTGSEYGLDSGEDMEYESDVHGEGSTVNDTVADVFADTISDTIADTGAAAVADTLPDTESHDCNSTIQTADMSPDTTSNESEPFVPIDANPSTKTPTIYEVETGIVRGNEKIKEYITRECLPFASHYRANRYLSIENELQALFHICRKLPIRIVKAWLLRELESRIVVPGQKTAIPSTADLYNPSDILDALQSIKMTTINAKANRAYGQMRLYKSVQGEIDGNYVPDPALKHGVAAHKSILSEMACRSAGNVSEKERKDRINSFNYEYDAGRKWLDVAKWFGGEGIVLIFTTAGIVNTVVTKDWTVFQRVCMEVISEYLPSITGLVSVLGEDALDDYCRFGYLEQEKIDAVKAFKGCYPPVIETEDDSAGDEDDMGEA
ncbi:hypothetical protein JMJ35_003461 [Cladonia borealis]|uniref:Uncharacterized protein n=1 Tax=Cladonia borealis TaxID=184061 RepID=A0AA39R4Z2_9LECA|nr:hypothetical protein JMJ35_003461 [Cladonia borealis]